MNETFKPIGLVDLAMRVTTGKNRASAMSDELQEVIKRNQSMWQSGYDEGYKAGRDSEMQASKKRDRDMLEEHGIDVEKMFEKVQQMIKDHEEAQNDQDKSN
jgi:hypothetical protein